MFWIWSALVGAAGGAATAALQPFAASAEAAPRRTSRDSIARTPVRPSDRDLRLTADFADFSDIRYTPSDQGTSADTLSCRRHQRQGTLSESPRPAETRPGARNGQRAGKRDPGVEDRR